MSAESCECIVYAVHIAQQCDSGFFGRHTTCAVRTEHTVGRKSASAYVRCPRCVCAVYRCMAHIKYTLPRTVHTHTHNFTRGADTAQENSRQRKLEAYHIAEIPPNSRTDDDSVNNSDCLLVYDSCQTKNIVYSSHRSWAKRFLSIYCRRTHTHTHPHLLTPVQRAHSHCELPVNRK